MGKPLARTGKGNRTDSQEVVKKNKIKKKNLLKRLIKEISLTILTGKDWFFTQFNTGMAGWLLLIFLMCLHN